MHNMFATRLQDQTEGAQQCFQRAVQIQDAQCSRSKVRTQDVKLPGQKNYSPSWPLHFQPCPRSLPNVLLSNLSLIWDFPFASAYRGGV